MVEGLVVTRGDAALVLIKSEAKKSIWLCRLYTKSGYFTYKHVCKVRVTRDDLSLFEELIESDLYTFSQ